MHIPVAHFSCTDFFIFAAQKISIFFIFCVYFFEFDDSLLFGGFFFSVGYFMYISIAHFFCTDFFIFAAQKFLNFLFFVFTFLNLMTLYYLEGFFFSVGCPRKKIHRESDGLNRSGDSSVAKAFKAHSEQGIIFNLFSAFIGLQFYRITIYRTTK